MKHIYYFTADWCNPCKRTKPIVEELNRESPEIKFQMIDVDSEIDLVKKFEIKSVPTFIVLKDGIEINRVTGAQTKEQLEGLMVNE
jgi:thioredoxin 1